MAKLTIQINKSVEENASVYYERAKKIKRKIEGAKSALDDSLSRLQRLQKAAAKEAQESKALPIKREWFEKFRWFVSSDGFLIIGGRDAATNEIVVKKHTEKGDLVFHTDMIGSPFFVIKSDAKKIPTSTIREAADATVSFSRAWKLGMPSSSVFYCSPEQLTKEAPSGEYVPRGGFITKGKLTYVENRVNCAIGLFHNKIMAGPLKAIQKNGGVAVELEQGSEKPSSLAKFIQKRIGGNIDDIIRVLPSGGCRIKK
jgi:predicted ribosome quality control (RQC) complex YloA/Tae2 family protein